ncbi:MAG TPA: hypothetical protein VM491_19340 [Burkholderiaceae bacterium]|nr:hypothetical protein [Burkholderiaceae bacterium]
MTEHAKPAAPIPALEICSGAGYGPHSTWIARRLAGARSRLVDRGLYKYDTELAELAARDAPQTLNFARDVLRLLPTMASEPAVARDSDGLILFEWVGSNARTFSLRIGADGMLVYNGRLGARRRISGAEPLGLDLSPIIRQAIQQVGA